MRKKAAWRKKQVLKIDQNVSRLKIDAECGANNKSKQLNTKKTHTRSN